jgi:hypothetical protein
MVDDHDIPSDQIPEAGLLEQRAPLDPPAVADPGDALADPDTAAAANVDEADRLEQQTPVLGDGEDDYPHDTSGAWS